MPRTCPKCRADLSSVPVKNGKIRCPECDALFAIARADERLQATPAPVRRLANVEGESPRSRASGKASPVRKEANTLPVVLILMGLGLGLMILLVVGGGLAAYFYIDRSAPAAPSIANEAPEAARNVVPVAQGNREPAKEPIQPAAQGGAAGNATLPLKELKAATVYIKGETATMASRGSGFVVHSQGTTVYIATNHHVVTPPKDDGDPFPPFFVPRMPGMPFGPRRPGIPRGPVLPQFPRGMGGPVGPQAIQLTVVFNSGTTREQSLPVTVVGDDAVNDLAILRAVGVADAPRPIDYQRSPELHETMKVVAFGFPFGEKLDLEQKNPAVTVSQGAISSLRGEGGQLGQVQLDLDLNPGNSGGPIVDERGILIGVAVAKWGNTRIGFAELGGRDSIAPLEKLANDNNVFYSNLARQAVESIKDRLDEAAPNARPRKAQNTPSSKDRQASSPPKLQGLLGRWTFDEGEGTRAKDASGNGLHATLVNAGWTDGVRGKALRLTGQGSYLDLGDSPKFSFTARAPFTFAFWTRTTLAKGTLLSQRNSRDGSAVLDILLDDGKAKAQVRQDGNDVFGPTEITSAAINDGEWHHLALIRDGDCIELFLDGRSQGRKSGTLSGGAITTDLRALGSERYWVGHFAFGDPHFEGDMDDFCIFDRALTADDIAALAKR